MSNIFSKFFMSLGINKKNKYLPAPEQNEATNNKTAVISADSVALYETKPYKVIASFDLNIKEPDYRGAIPDATIKFYPLDK